MSLRAALHRLEDHQVAGHVVVDQVQRQQRVAQVVEHAHEQDEVEALASWATS
jgi:hypothetical protein